MKTVLNKWGYPVDSNLCDCRELEKKYHVSSKISAKQVAQKRLSLLNKQNKDRYNFTDPIRGCRDHQKPPFNN